MFLMRRSIGLAGRDDGAVRSIRMRSTCPLFSLFVVSQERHVPVEPFSDPKYSRRGVPRVPRPGGGGGTRHTGLATRRGPGPPPAYHNHPKSPPVGILQLISSDGSSQLYHNREDTFRHLNQMHLNQMFLFYELPSEVSFIVIPRLPLVCVDSATCATLSVEFSCKH